MAMKIMPAPTIILLPIAVIAIYLLSVAIGMLLIPIGGLYTDVEQVIVMLLRFVMFLTPVVYPISERGVVRQVMLFNPVTPILECVRDWLVV